MRLEMDKKVVASIYKVYSDYIVHGLNTPDIFGSICHIISPHADF